MEAVIRENWSLRKKSQEFRLLRIEDINVTRFAPLEFCAVN